MAQHGLPACAARLEVCPSDQGDGSQKFAHTAVGIHIQTSLHVPAFSSLGMDLTHTFILTDPLSIHLQLAAQPPTLHCVPAVCQAGTVLDSGER